LSVVWREVTPMIWLGLAYAVLVSAFLGWLVWGWVNAVRGVARSAPLMYLMPPVAGLVAWAVTGERYTGIKLAGAALTLGGVALAQFTSARVAVVRDTPAPVD
jgi:drug/metabolite transporter (DMT)-like permease